MEWTKQAQEAVSKVPFFVRDRVKRRVEEEAARCGAKEVNLDHVLACQKKFVNKMENEDGDYYLFNVGTEAAPKFLVLEYSKESGLKDGQAYKVFADVIGVVENYPALAARFVYLKD